MNRMALTWFSLIALACTTLVAFAQAPDGNAHPESQIVSGGAEQIKLGNSEMNSRAYCSAFNFKGGDQQKKVGSLSGGERNRVHMARLL